MSEAIKAAKSKKYLKSQLSGYTLEQSSDVIEHITAQSLPGDRLGLDVVAHGVYQVNLAAMTIEAGSSTRVIKITGHGASVGDILKISSGADSGAEYSILSCPTANEVIIASNCGGSVGDSVSIMRHVTPKYGADGSLSTTSGPVKFLKDAVETTVSYDTVTPTNSDALPVNIVTVNGHGISTTVDLTGAQINVQLSHTGASPDSTRIGDGTNLLGINASNEAKTHDADAKTELQAINTELDTQTTTLGNIDTSLNNIESDVDLIASTVVADGAAQPANGQLIGGHNGAGLFRHMKVSNTGEVIVEVSTSVLPTGAATEAKQDAEAVLIGAVSETAPVSDTASSGLNGRLQRIAQRITSLISLLPASLGQSTMANSLTITIASDQSAVAVSDSSASSIDTNIGAQADAVATTDTGTFSLISLTKKIAQNITAMSAKLPAALGATTSAASLSVAPATDAVFSTKPKALTNSYAEYLTLTTVQTFTAPASAVGGKIMAQDSNSANVRYKQNGTATTTSGMQLQPGRSEDFTGGSDITVVSESGTNAVFIQWTIQA